MVINLTDLHYKIKKHHPLVVIFRINKFVGDNFSAINNHSMDSDKLVFEEDDDGTFPNYNKIPNHAKVAP